MSSSEKRIKTKHIMVRVSPEEKAEIESNAHNVGLSAPAYLVHCGLSKRIVSKVDKHLVNELRKLGGLQKHLFNERQKKKPRRSYSYWSQSPRGS